MQLPLTYQPLEDMYCVRTTYVAADPADLSRGIYVHNEARKGSIAGERVGVPPGGNESSVLVAFPDDLPRVGDDNERTAASKLRIGLRVFDAVYRGSSIDKNETLPSASPELLDLLPPKLRDLMAVLPPGLLPVLGGLLPSLRDLLAGSEPRSPGERVDLCAFLDLIIGLLPTEVVQLSKRVLFGPVCS